MEREDFDLERNIVEWLMTIKNPLLDSEESLNFRQSMQIVAYANYNDISVSESFCVLWGIDHGNDDKD